jgi:hypothetical protein
MGLFDGKHSAIAPMVSVILHRTTTKLADQTLCASTIIGDDPKPLLDAPGKGMELQENRMEIFLKDIGKFPPDVIFNAGTRLKRKGFHWAPNSFLGLPKDGYLRSVEGKHAEYREGEGLAVQLPGFIVNSPAVQNQTQLTAMVAWSDDMSLNFIIDSVPNNEHPSGLFWEPKACYAIVLRPPAGSLPPADFDEVKNEYLEHNSVPAEAKLKLFSIFATTTHNAVVGVIQEVKRGEDGTVQHIRLRHECLAKITLLRPSEPASGVKVKTSGKFLKRKKASFLLIVFIKAAAEKDAKSGDGNTPVLCELLNDDTQWFLS